MKHEDARRHHRIPYVGPVRVAWDHNGETRFAMGKCIDCSESGLRIEVPVVLPVGTVIVLTAQRIRVQGSARVKHAARYGARYILGVELNTRIHETARSALQEPWALRSSTGGA